MDVMNNAISAVKNINVISQAIFRKDVVTFTEEEVVMPNFEVADEEEA
jgi:succinylarginine dihydrolase